jgi:phospholipid/cholesterol/gamma-HCH transport system substrate-binding protein
VEYISCTKGFLLRRSNAELVVGGVIFLSLFILTAGILWLKEVKVSSSMVRYTVLFPNIGTLQQGDPVTVNGVKKGFVAGISLYNSKVAVVLKIDKNIVFTDSSKVTVQNIGLMGERMVGIQLSEKGIPYTPDSRNKITYIPGFFDSGIAEAMGMLGSVLSDVSTLIDTVQTIVKKTVGDTGFIAFFGTLIIRLDTISAMVGQLIRDNRTELTASISNVHTISSDLKHLLARNSSTVDTIMARGNQLTAEALEITDRIDSLTINLNMIASRIERGEGSIGALVNDDAFVMDLKRSVADLDSLVKNVDAKGLKLRLKLWGNRKYFKDDTLKNKL